MKPASLILSLFLFCSLFTKVNAQKQGSVNSAQILMESSLDFKLADTLFWKEVVQKGKDTLSFLPPKAQGDVQYAIAQYYLWNQQLDSALVYFGNAEPLFEANAALTADFHLTYAETWRQRRFYNKASTHLFKALDILEAENDQEKIAACLAQIGLVLDLTENYTEAIDYANQAIRIQKEYDNPEALALSYEIRSRPLIFVDSLDYGIKTIDSAINILNLANSNSELLYDCYNSKGNLLKYTEAYDSAIYYYKLNLEYFTKTGDLRGIIAAKGNLGHAYRLKGEYETALPYSLSALEMGVSSGYTRNVWENHLHASVIYEMLGDFENALKHNIDLVNEREVFFQQNIDNLKAEYQIEYETEKKNQQIQSQQQAIASQKRIQSLSFGILGLLSILLVGSIIVSRNSRRKNEVLRIKNEEVELLLKEIHHRVKNNLQRVSSLLYLQSNFIKDPNALDAIKESQHRVQSMSLIHKKLYSGKNLTSIKMDDYLKSLGSGLLDSFNLPGTSINIQYNVEPLEADVDTAIPIGLIVNELVTNALKYAFSGDKAEGCIDINLYQKADALCLEVADDGVGISDADVNTDIQSGFGTQLVQLLATQLGGTMEKISEVGTKVVFRFREYKLA